MNFGDETNVSGMPDPLNQGQQNSSKDQTVINRPIAGRPQILAPQANDPLLPAPVIHEVKRRKLGPILVLLALIAVAVAAALAAAYSQLGRDDTATSTPSSTISIVTTQPTTTAPPPTTIDPNALQIAITESPFICDGETRPMGLISQAAPNEQISFSSPQAEELSPGQAGEDGTLPIRWQCDPDQIGQVWNLTAAGVTSGKVGFFDVTGAAPGAANADGTSVPITVAPGEEPTTTAVPQPGAGELGVVVNQNPFVCNGQAREFAKLSGAEPNEEITFTSPQASGIRSGNADINGERVIRWSCNPDQVGTVWELTATGQTSGRTVTFTFTGS